jgi:UDP-N-acetyl-2-amino-2-deoxyglucuronate dehydrogenase
MIAGFHAEAIKRTLGARLIGVVDRSKEKADAFAQQHGASISSADLDALLRSPDVHVICVTTPSGAHLEPALAAIAAGKHIIVEKPIEITTERADEIISAAEKKGVLLAPIFQARFGHGAQRVKAALDAGRLGRIVLASAYVKWHRAGSYYTGWKGTLALDGGGAVINQSIHGLDLLQWFVGMPKEVFAHKTRRVHAQIEAEDTAVAGLRFSSGALGTVEATTAAWPGWSRRIELCGETGSIVLEDDHIARWDFQTTEPEDATIRSAANDHALGSGAGAANAISIEGHLRQIGDLVAAVRDGSPLTVDGREARKAVAFVNAIYTAADTRQPVTLA